MQGGPGMASSGYGNFVEIGPLDLNLEPRNKNWVQHANILFVDSPVGAGFAYTEEQAAYTENNTQIANDFVEFLKKFYKSLPEFSEVPFYIFGISYGGKMAVEIALKINEAWKNQELKSNIEAIILGNPWISPIDSIMNYAPFLLNLGEIDQYGYNKLMSTANTVKDGIESENYTLAFEWLNQLHWEIGLHTNFLNPNNVLKKKPQRITDDSDIIDDEAEEKEKLGTLMNTEIKEALGISRRWRHMNDDVFVSLCSDFLKPVTHLVEQILNETDISVAVYNSQLDLKVNIPGTISWVEKLNFNDKNSWDASPRKAFLIDGFYEGYVKKFRHFAFYWVKGAGHKVPVENPAALEYILRDVTKNLAV